MIFVALHCATRKRVQLTLEKSGAAWNTASVFPVCGLNRLFASVRKAMLLRAFLLFFLTAAVPAFGGVRDIWLGWDEPPAEENIVEHRVFYGTHSGQYTTEAVSYYSDGALIYGLEAGQKYYFVVKSVDADGTNSAFSAEISYTVPVPKPAVLKTEIYYDGDGVAYGMGVSSEWQLSFDWELDYSTDLKNWYPWQTGHGADFWTYVDFSWSDQFYFRLALY